MASDALAHVNWLAVLVAALGGFAVGGIWYGPLFRNAWMQETGVTMERAKTANMPMIYGTVLLLDLVATTSLAMFIGGGDLRFGAFAGFMTGLTFVATSLGITYLFEMRSLRLWLINSGYQIVFFTLAGAILGAWH